MPRQIFDFDPPDRFIAGTVGQPGSRTFFLQARLGGRLTSVGLEKAQLAMLAQRIDELLDEVLRRSAGAAPVPALPPSDSVDNAPLDTPIEEEFRVGTMSLSWEVDRGRVVLECFAVSAGNEQPDAPADDDSGPLLRVILTGASARSFAKRALAVVAAGRPPCPFCAGPLDPGGHICPRSNGYRR